jgi:hypothetical protein
MHANKALQDKIVPKSEENKAGGPVIIKGGLSHQSQPPSSNLDKNRMRCGARTSRFAYFSLIKRKAKPFRFNISSILRGFCWIDKYSYGPACWIYDSALVSRRPGALAMRAFGLQCRAEIRVGPGPIGTRRTGAIHRNPLTDTSLKQKALMKLLNKPRATSPRATIPQPPPMLLPSETGANSKL